MNNQEIIPAIEREVIFEELKLADEIKSTENGNKIYTFSGTRCPNLMKEVGRLREVSFREGGGGSGKDIDIDQYDEFDHPLHPDLKVTKGFKQLIVFNPKEQEIIGGYRYARMGDLLTENIIDSPTSALFDISTKFVNVYARQTIELGRSFIQPNYQPNHNAKKGLYSLDNLWEGVGSLIVDNDEIENFFGKVTMYKTYNREARNMILYYLEKHFQDLDGLVVPKPELIPQGLKDEVEFLMKLFSGNSERQDRKILLEALRSIKQSMPPLFKQYSDLSPNMKVFGTAINHHFGDVEETGIFINIHDIVEHKKIKYILSYANLKKLTKQ